MGNKRVVRSAVLGSYDADDFVNGFNEAFWVKDAEGSIIGARFDGGDEIFASSDAAIINDGGGVVSLGTDVTPEAIQTLLQIAAGQAAIVLNEDGTISFGGTVTALQVRGLLSLPDGVALVQDGLGTVSLGTNVTAQAVKNILVITEPAIVNEGSDVLTLGPDVTVAAIRTLLEIPGDAAVLNDAGTLSFGVDVDAAEFRTFIGVSDAEISWNTYAVDSTFVMTYPDGTYEYVRRGANIFREVILTPQYVDRFYATRDTNTGALTDLLATRGVA